MFQKLVLYLASALIVAHAVVIPTPDSNAGEHVTRVVVDIADHPRLVAGSCNDWSLIPNEASLAAACRNTAGTSVGTSIAIGNCVANNNGGLGCQTG